MLLPTILLLASAQTPFGVLLGKSTLVFKGWPVSRGSGEPCGKPAGYWQVNLVLRGDKSLVGHVVPIYNTSAQPLLADARTTMMFLKGKPECPELVEQQEYGVDTLKRAAAQPTDCGLQLRAVEQVLRELATDCEVDADCAAYNFHPNSCERPRPYAKRVSAAMPAFWAELANRARAACASNWSKQPACEMTPIETHCHEHECLAGPSPEKAPALTQATLSESCAPTDAGATSISVHPRAAAFPTVGVIMWGSDRPLRGKAGSFTLVREYTANYCGYEGGCQVLKTIHLQLNMSADNTGTLELEAETQKGEKIRVHLPAAYGPLQRVMCR